MTSIPFTTMCPPAVRMLYLMASAHDGHVSLDTYPVLALRDRSGDVEAIVHEPAVGGLVPTEHLEASNCAGELVVAPWAQEEDARRLMPYFKRLRNLALAQEAGPELATKGRATA
jgi:hypothetical protein